MTIGNDPVVLTTPPAVDDPGVVVRILGGSAVVLGIVSTKTPLTPSAPDMAVVGVASAQAVAANAARLGLVLVNVSDNLISLGFGAPAVLGSGVTLYPGGVFNMGEYDFTLVAVNAIASVAASPLAIQEYT